MLGVGPGPVGEGGIHRNREQLDVVPVHFGELVADGTQLAGAYAAERQRVKDEHDVLGAAEARQPHGRAMLVVELKVGRLVAYFYRHAWSFHRIREYAVTHQVCHLSAGAEAWAVRDKTYANGRSAGHLGPAGQDLIFAPSARRAACPTSRGPRSRSRSATGRPWARPRRYRSAQHDLTCPPSA